VGTRGEEKLSGVERSRAAATKPGEAQPARARRGPRRIGTAALPRAVHTVASRRIAAYDRCMPAGGDARTRRYVARLDARRRTLADEVEDDVAPVRGLSLRERGEWVASACRSAWDILRGRTDAQRVIDHVDPLAPDFAAKWAALMARRRNRVSPGA
jgi:hypothetical protein